MADKRAGIDYLGVGVGVIIPNEEGKIPLTLRGPNTRNRHGLWALPGGGCESEQNVGLWMGVLGATVTREVEEEIGLFIEPLGCIGFLEELTDGQQWLDAIYVARIVGGTLENREPHKFDAVAYFDPRRMPKRIANNTKAAVELYLRNPPYIPILSVVE